MMLFLKQYAYHSSSSFLCFLEYNLLAQWSHACFIDVCVCVWSRNTTCRAGVRPTRTNWAINLTYFWSTVVLASYADFVPLNIMYGLDAWNSTLTYVGSNPSCVSRSIFPLIWFIWLHTIIIIFLIWVLRNDTMTVVVYGMQNLQLCPL